jgi:hypothetical protein
MFRKATLSLAAMIAIALPASGGAIRTGAARQAQARPDDKVALDLLRKAFGPRGHNLSFDETHSAFDGTRPKLEAIIAVLETCLPKHSSDYNTTWADADSDMEESLHCSIGGSDEPIGKIKALLRAAGILCVAYTPPASPDDHGQVRAASFMIFAVGMAGSGASTSINFFANQASCAPEEQRDDGVYLVAKPLTGPPCNWVWEHDEE